MFSSAGRWAARNRRRARLLVHPLENRTAPAQLLVTSAADSGPGSLRAVLAEAGAKGLTVLPEGSGIARIQSPSPGAILHEGERIRVQFSR